MLAVKFEFVFKQFELVDLSSRYLQILGVDSCW